LVTESVNVAKRHGYKIPTSLTVQTYFSSSAKLSSRSSGTGTTSPQLHEEIWTEKLALCQENLHKKPFIANHCLSNVRGK
jgi:hypothetical protein